MSGFVSNSVINGGEHGYAMNSSFAMTPSGITISGSTKKYATYEDLRYEKNPPDYAYVVDASGDPTVGSGGAIYRWTTSGWKKMYEEESMDQDLKVDDVINQVDGLKADIESIRGALDTIEQLKGQITELSSELAAAKAELEEVKARPIGVETIFVTEGTESAPVAVNLVDDEWCVMTSPFIATLPSNPKDGDSIHMSVEHGSANMKVVASDGATINGSPYPCLVGVDENGIAISYVSFYFVYNAKTNNWLVL